MGGLPGRLTVCLVTVAVTGTLTACSSSKSPSNTPSGSPASSAAVPSVDAGAFTADFSVMKQLTGLASQRARELLRLTTVEDRPLAKLHGRAVVRDADQYELHEKCVTGRAKRATATSRNPSSTT